MNDKLQKLTRYEISNEEIQSIFPKINDGSRWHINVGTFEFIDGIIKLWFLERGITFWNMPEIERYELTGEPVSIVFYCN